MARYAIVELASGNVVNVIDYDAEPTTPPPGFPEGFAAIQHDRAGPGWSLVNGVPTEPVLPAPPALVPAFLARDLFAQLAVADYSNIKAAIASNDALGLLWASLQAQGDAPIRSDAARFLAGWAGLKQALGADRAAVIAASLGIPDA